MVTHSAADITAAAKIAGFTHRFCFADTLNLVLQKSIKVIKSIQEKVETIAEHNCS
jgi:hypothetical protein